MTFEEIKDAELETVETRAAEIAQEAETAEAETLDTLTAELDAIEQRKAEIMAQREEQRRKAEEIAAGAGEVIEEPKEERKPMNDKEYRSTPEYLDAWVEYQKGRASEEQRALLTINADLGSGATGTVAVPTYVEDRIHTAWENNEIMRRIRRTYYKGNLKVGYEASSDGAVIHEEGADAIDEENLVLAFVDLVPKMIKKLVIYSTEVMDIKGQAWVDYIFDEVEYQIVKKVVDEALAAMVASSLTATATAAGATLSTVDIINAEGSLGGEATDPVIITSRSNAAALKAAVLGAGYGYDPFDGLPVFYADMPTGYEAFVADLSGVQANFPDGDQVKFIFDEYTLAPSDMVRVIGRLYVGIDVVAPGKVAAIGTASE